MPYFQVLVSSPQFHGKEPLTYSYETSLVAGTVVEVALRNRLVAGFVVKEVSKPAFTTKPITKVIVDTPLPTPLLSLVDWLGDYYPAPLGTLAQMILPGSLLRKKAVSALAATPADKLVTPPTLTKQQAAAVATINGGGSSFLVHGDTGTGKTRLYIELARQALEAGQSALLLTPEIGLTSQLENRVRQALPFPVITVHSQLTPAERRTVWLQILEATGPVVVIGPRSALFMPLKNLGVIVVDEAHDHAYKQESAPRYQALRVAAQLATLHHGKLVMGTATPLINEYALAESKKIPIIRLTEKPAGEHINREIAVVDLKDREQFGSHPYLSTQLLDLVKATLAKKEQVLILLNRRGTARLVLCQNCGWQALCPNCDLPLTYHGDHHILRCHTCGHQESVPSSCPTCQSTNIIFRGLGTKSLTAEVQRAFPQAKVQRFDTDNRKADRLEQHYSRIEAGDVDILVGTQLLAKGLDLPRLTVVGVIAADTSLYLPDYTAEEQTYQLLTQVIGRVGRGHRPGHVIIQSYSPGNPAIQTAINQNWQEFYQNQLTERRSFGFPPFYHTLKLSCVRATNNSAKKAAEDLKSQLQQSGLRIELVGPAPSFYEKVGGKFQWQLLVKAKSRAELLKVIQQLPANWTHDIDPLNLL